MAYDFDIRKKRDLLEAVHEYGIVPYFRTSIPGFSLQEHGHPSVLFSDSGDDTWEWKGPVIRETGCAYGKFFEKKAACVGRELFPDLANCRRDGYDFDARHDDVLAICQDRRLYDRIDANGPILSKELRRTGGCACSGRRQRTGGKKGFDTSVARLQEQCCVLIGDFVCTIDRKGNRRGWGAAEYNIPEKHFGDGFAENVHVRDPKESCERLLEHLVHVFPHVPVSDLKKYRK